MPKFFAAFVFLVTLSAISAEQSSAAMWLARGPGNTSMAVDSACKAREINPPGDCHLWIDCWIAEKNVTLLIASAAPFVANDFTHRNAGEFFSKFTEGTEWSVFKDNVTFFGGSSFPGFEPFAQMRLIGRLCDAGKQCADAKEKLVAFKVLGTARTTVALIAMGDVEQKEYIVKGKSVATYRFFPDPITAMIDTFNFATIQNPPY